MQEGPERLSDQLAPAVAEHRLQRRVGDEEAAFGVDPADADRSLLGQDRPLGGGLLPARQRPSQLSDLAPAVDVGDRGAPLDRDPLSRVRQLPERVEAEAY